MMARLNKQFKLLSQRWQDGALKVIISICYIWRCGIIYVEGVVGALCVKRNRRLMTSLR